MIFKKQVHFTSDIGRMGNQMFQYACAKEMEKSGVISSLSHLDKLEYFVLSPFARSTNKIKSFLFFRLWKKIFGVNIINTELNCLHKSYLDELSHISKPTTIWGMFQSADYFPNSAKLLQQHFRVKEKYRVGLKKFLQTNNLEAGQYTAIHIRQTDYKGFTVPGLKGDDFTLPLSYYTNSLLNIAANDMPLVFVSDNPENIEALFPEIKNKIISRNDAITDFLILQNAGMLVLSNSTFAWWAAYLNAYNPIIYCPQYFLGFKENKEVPINIYPQSWIQVSI